MQGTLLWLLRSFCPAEKLRILRSAALALYVLAAVPYLFICRLTYWLPLTNEELTTAVPVLLTGCCVLALLVNISFLSYAIAEEEKRTMLQLRIAAEQQQQQYLLRKTAVDSVRRKYHDLKIFCSIWSRAAIRQPCRRTSGRSCRRCSPMSR